MEQQEYVIKVKNILGKNKEITLLDGSKYLLKDKDEKIIGDYSNESKPIIFKLLKSGFEVSKILKENIQEYMIIKSIKNVTQTVSDEIINDTNKDIKSDEEKPKKRRGRPPKNKN